MARRVILFFALLGMAGSPLSAFADATAVGIRHHPHADKTRVVLDLSTAASYSTSQDNGRITCVVRGATADASTSSIHDHAIKTVTTRQDGSDLVVTVHMQDASAQWKAFSLNDPHRIVIDVFRDPRSTTVTPGTFLPGFASPGEFAELTAAAQLETEAASVILERGIRRIVIDAGHGGHDPGGVNPQTGLREKDITLAVSRKTRDVIRANSELEVFLTRDGDYYVDLSDRTVLANQFRGDLFVSIHCNSHSGAQAHGTEVYFVSEKASDAQAEEVAARENALALDDPFFAADAALDPEAIVLDLERQLHLDASRRMANLALLGITGDNDLRNRGVKSARFFVLLKNKMPSVLVETAFISNAQEARSLSTEAFQQGLAESIWNAVSAFSGQ